MRLNTCYSLSSVSYSDCSAEAVGVPGLGQPNVTYPDAKVEHVQW